MSNDITKGAIEAVLREEDHEILTFREGTLYPLLYRLEARGFVTSKEREAPSGKTRRYYHLTKKGTSYLEKRRSQFAKLSKELHSALRLSRVSL